VRRGRLLDRRERELHLQLVAAQDRLEHGQIEAALARAAAATWRPPVTSPSLLAVGALGGSAIAAELTAGLYHDRLPRPLLVVRDYAWPACVDHGALALLSSYSGETEETLALYRAAGERGIPRVAMTTGGTLGAWCARDRVPCAALPAGSPPRAALFSGWVMLTALLHALDWVDDPAGAWREAAAVLRAGNATLGPAVPATGNPAKRLALALDGRLVLLYAGTGGVGAVATRVRQQLNENAKMLGHSALVPELNHNEIMGWERAPERSAPVAVVLLRDAEDSAATRARLDLTGEMVARQGATVHEVTSSGEGRLARLASLVQFGDYLSLYLALARGVDPTPVASIDEFKRRLAGSARPAR
jgi:glucose/mannose-6-phosphate isomerase